MVYTRKFILMVFPSPRLCPILTHCSIALSLGPLSGSPLFMFYGGVKTVQSATTNLVSVGEDAATTPSTQTFNPLPLL